ncbi:MAG TPA: methyltransferase domain-containing protein [Chloroflexota bacterium]|nr:methyltransferase domain-containing protein [Chloroflexota bacterium]
MSAASAAGRLGFLRHFLRNPRQLGSITPSSRFLTRAVVEQIDFERARRIVELGPGTGVFTRELLRRLSRDGALLALDTNRDFVALLASELPDPRLSAVHASAEHVAEHVAAREWESADVIVSGIPYTLLPRAVTTTIVHACWRALAPAGLFVGYQYSPYLRPFLMAQFGNCRLKLVLRNLPPAVVFASRSGLVVDSTRRRLAE